MTMQFNFDDLVIAAGCGEEIARERVEQLERDNAILRSFAIRFSRAVTWQQIADICREWNDYSKSQQADTEDS